MAQTHIIANGVVVDSIMATLAQAEEIYPEALCIDGAQFAGSGVGWLWDGQALTPPVITNPQDSPKNCTRRQGLLALLSYGFKRADIEAQIEAIEHEMEREAAWIEYLADTWELDNPRLQAMWVALGGVPEQLPDVFRLAVAL